MSIKRVVKDFQEYLYNIEELSKPLSVEQKSVLENVLAVQLAMLVAFKRDSKLGEVSFSHLFPDYKPKKKSTNHFDEEED